MAGDFGKMLMLLLSGAGGFAGAANNDREATVARKKQDEETARRRQREDLETQDYQSRLNAPKDFSAFAQRTPGMPGYAPPPGQMGYSAGRYGAGSPFGDAPVGVAPGVAPPPFQTEEEALRALAGSGLSQYATGYGADLLKMGLPSRDETRQQEIITLSNGRKVTREQLPEELLLNPLQKPRAPASPVQIALAREALTQLGFDPTMIPDTATEDDLEMLDSLFRTTGKAGGGVAPKPSYNEATGTLPPPSYAGNTGLPGAPAPTLPRMDLRSMARGGQAIPPALQAGGQNNAPAPSMTPPPMSIAPPPPSIKGPSGVPMPGIDGLPNNLQFFLPEFEKAKNLPAEQAISAFNALRQASEMFPEAPIHPVPMIDSKTRKADFLRDDAGTVLTFDKATAETYAKQYGDLLGKDVPNAEAPKSVSVWSFSPFEGAMPKKDSVSGRTWYEGTMSTPGGAMPGGVYAIDTRPQPFTYANGKTVYKTPNEIEAIKGSAALKDKAAANRRAEEQLRLDKRAESRYQAALGLDQKRYQDARANAADEKTQAKLDRIANLSKDWRVEKTEEKTNPLTKEKYLSRTGKWTWKPGTPESVKSEVLRLGNETKGELHDEYQDIGQQAGLKGKALTDYITEQMKALGYE